MERKAEASFIDPIHDVLYSAGRSVKSELRSYASKESNYERRDGASVQKGSLQALPG